MADGVHPGAASGPVGVVSLGGKAIPVSPLSQRANREFWAWLTRKFWEVNGSHYRIAKKRLDDYAPADREIAVRRLAEMDGKNAPPSEDALDEFRGHPEVVAYELWLRAKPHDPALTLAEVQAVVTATNAQDILWQIVDATTGAAGKGE